MDRVLEEIYATGVVVDKDGVKYPVTASIDEGEGAFLSDFIGSRSTIVRTLEVGCAYGLSSLSITTATKGRPGAHHTIVDPYQNTQWKGIGIDLLRRSGVDFFSLVEQPSEFALPRLAQEAGEPLDLVFIDGWHTFDHTLLDLFYANRLIGVGGYIIVDDCDWRSVAKALFYFSCFPCYEIAGASRPSRKRRRANQVARFLDPSAGRFIPRDLHDNYFSRARYPSMVALKKIAADDRNYDWFTPF